MVTAIVDVADCPGLLTVAAVGVPRLSVCAAAVPVTANATLPVAVATPVAAALTATV